MIHLGTTVTAFVDGELSAHDEARVRQHLVSCERCRQAVAAEDNARHRTRSAGDLPHPSAALQDRLLAMPVAVSQTAPAAPATRLPTGLALAGAVVVLGVLVMTLVAVGTPRTVAPPTAAVVSGTPAGSITVLALPLATSSPARDGLAWMSAHGWTAPSALPDGLRVEDVVLEADGSTSTLHVLLGGPGGPGGDVQVMQRVGQLDPDAVADLPVHDVGGRSAYLIDGWWVLESGDCVVAVDAGTGESAQEVVQAMPGPRVSDGLLDRLAAGWDRVVSGG